MSIYEGLKDAINIAQKADNIDLYKKLLDLSKDALDLKLKSAKQLDERIEYHKLEEVDTLHTEYPYITLKDDPLRIRYCAICWGRDKKLIQLLDELNCEECLRLKGY